MVLKDVASVCQGKILRVQFLIPLHEHILTCVLWIVLKLDYIPRYGRLYTLNPGDSWEEFNASKPTWHYMKNGHWGFYTLDRMNLLVPYMDYLDPDM